MPRQTPNIFLSYSRQDIGIAGKAAALAAAMPLMRWAA